MTGLVWRWAEGSTPGHEGPPPGCSQPAVPLLLPSPRSAAGPRQWCCGWSVLPCAEGVWRLPAQEHVRDFWTTSRLRQHSPTHPASRAEPTGDSVRLGQRAFSWCSRAAPPRASALSSGRLQGALSGRTFLSFVPWFEAGGLLIRPVILLLLLILRWWSQMCIIIASTKSSKWMKG